MFDMEWHACGIELTWGQTGVGGTKRLCLYSMSEDIFFHVVQCFDQGSFGSSSLLLHPISQTQPHTQHGQFTVTCSLLIFFYFAESGKVESQLKTQVFPVTEGIQFSENNYQVLTRIWESGRRWGRLNHKPKTIMTQYTHQEVHLEVHPQLQLAEEQNL